LANCADERPVSSRILRQGRMDLQRPGDGAAFADPVVPEYRPPPRSRVVAPDFRDGFLAAVKPQKIPGRKRCFGYAASDRRARGDFTAHAAPNTRRNHAF